MENNIQFLNYINSNKYLLNIINNALIYLKNKFNLLDPGCSSKKEEYWFLILNNISHYLNFNYNEKVISIDKLNGIIKYIEWFKKYWPPNINKKGNYMLPKITNPPEILI